MLPVLYKYFILNSELAIPGIGYFSISREPASFDFSKKIIAAPVNRIAFIEGQSAIQDKLYHFIAQQYKIEKDAAIAAFSNFVNSISKKLRADGKVQLEGFGLVIRHNDGKLILQERESLPSSYPDVVAERTIREQVHPNTLKTENVTAETPDVNNNEELQSEVKDYWWLFALILACIAIAAIAYYYYQNGNIK